MVHIPLLAPPLFLPDLVSSFIFTTEPMMPRQHWDFSRTLSLTPTLIEAPIYIVVYPSSGIGI